MSLHPSRLVVECPLCKASYKEAAVQLLQESPAAKLFHCTCPTCGRCMLAFMTDHHGWVSTIGLVTDLKVNDALRLQGSTPVGADECLELYTAIHERSGDLCLELLSPRATPRGPKNS